MEDVSNLWWMECLLSDNNLTSVFGEMFDIAETDEYGCSYLDNKLIHCQSLSNVEHYKIKEGTEIICDMAFGENKNLKSISSTTFFISTAFLNVTTPPIPKK